MFFAFAVRTGARRSSRRTSRRSAGATSTGAGDTLAPACPAAKIAGSRLAVPGARDVAFTSKPSRERFVTDRAGEDGRIGRGDLRLLGVRQFLQQSWGEHASRDFPGGGLAGRDGATGSRLGFEAQVLSQHRLRLPSTGDVPGVEAPVEYLPEHGRDLLAVGRGGQSCGHVVRGSIILWARPIAHAQLTKIVGHDAQNHGSPAPIVLGPGFPR
jgi:hypothetical protein